MAEEGADPHGLCSPGRKKGSRGPSRDHHGDACRQYLGPEKCRHAPMEQGSCKKGERRDKTGHQFRQSQLIVASSATQHSQVGPAEGS